MLKQTGVSPLKLEQQTFFTTFTFKYKHTSCVCLCSHDGFSALVWKATGTTAREDMKMSDHRTNKQE